MSLVSEESVTNQLPRKGLVNALSRQQWITIGALALLCALSQMPALLQVFQGRMAFSLDAIRLFASWRGLAKEALTQGILPLWNPYTFCGLPLLANNQVGLLYPPNVVYWLLPMSWAMWLDVWLHQFLLAGGGYVLARSLGLSRAGALLCAVCLGLGGSVQAHASLGHLTWHAARAWIPWEMWATLQLLRTRRAFYFALLGVIAGLHSSSGYPPLFFLGIALCAGMVIAWSITQWGRTRNKRQVAHATSHTTSIEQSDERNATSKSSRTWLRRLPLLLPGITIAAACWLPPLEALRVSVHGTALNAQEALSGGALWETFARLLVPDFYGAGAVFRRGENASVAHEEVAYIGLMAQLLALGVPLWTWRDNSRRWPTAVPWLWALLFIAALLAVGAATPIYPWCYEHIGIFQKMRVPARWMELWFIASALLAGFGFDGLFAAPAATSQEASELTILNQQKRRRFFAASLALVSLGLLIVEFRLLFSDKQTLFSSVRPFAGLTQETLQELFYWEAIKATRNAFLAAALPLTLLILSNALGEHSKKPKPQLSPAHRGMASWLIRGLLLVAVCDLMGSYILNANATYQALQEHEVSWPRELVAQARPDQRWATLLEPSQFGALNDGSTSHIATVGGYENLVTRDFAQWITALQGQTSWFDIHQPSTNSPLLDVAAVTHTLAGVPVERTPRARGFTGDLVARRDNWTLWNHATAWPRCYLSRRIVSLPKEEQLPYLASHSTFNARHPLAVITAPNPISQIPTQPLENGEAVLDFNMSLNRFSVETKTTRPTFLVVTEANYPGWRAWVNGQSQQVQTANFLFRGLQVPAGQSQVHLVFDSSICRFAFFVSLCGLGALSLITSVAVGKNSRKATPQALN